jgi:hypothetical protein
MMFFSPIDCLSYLQNREVKNKTKQKQEQQQKKPQTKTTAGKEKSTQPQ